MIDNKQFWAGILATGVSKSVSCSSGNRKAAARDPQQESRPRSIPWLVLDLCLSLSLLPAAPSLFCCCLLRSSWLGHPFSPFFTQFCPTTCQPLHCLSPYPPSHSVLSLSLFLSLCPPFLCWALLLSALFCLGPQGRALDGSFRNAETLDYLDELGGVVLDLVNRVPEGWLPLFL